MSVLRRYTLTLAGITAALIVLLGMRPVAVETILAGYAIALAGIALAAMATAMREAQRTPPSEFERELTRERIMPSRPVELVRVQRDITLSMSSAAHAHERLRPLVATIAGVRRCDDADVAAFVTAPPPADRSAPGLPLRTIRRMIDALERA